MFGAPGEPVAKPAGKPDDEAKPPKESGYVDESFVVDPATRYAGTVGFFSKLKGYGFLEMTQKGFAPNDAVFVHWRSIKSEDRFPFLYKGLQVEFSLVKWKEYGKYTLRAKEVTQPGGAALALQDALDAEKKTFVGAQDLRYTGTLKFYDPRYGFGYVALDEGYAVGPEVPKELRVERSEVNSANTAPGWMSDVKVEFGIWKTTRGVCKVYNMTLPGGVPVTMPALEHRSGTDSATYEGEVTMWNWHSGWGFIKPAAGATLPQAVKTKLAEQTAASTARASAKGKTTSGEELLYIRRADVLPGNRLSQGAKVTFQVYTDDVGAGAYQVALKPE